MAKCFAGVAAGAIFAIVNISTAWASPAAAPLLEGGYALAPFSFVKFCIDYPKDCPKAAGPSRIRLTSGRMAELARVNREVNASIAPTPDTSALRFWRLNVDAGDCNNFAVQKRHELMQRGWPAAALALTVAKTSRGEGHLVVTVRTDKGDLVLDNLRSNIVAWQKTGYHWIMRQSERNPQYWVDLDGGHAAPAYAERSFDNGVEVADAKIPPPPAARAVAGLIAKAVGWAQAESWALAPNYQGVVATLNPLLRARSAKPATSANLQAELAPPIDPLLFGFI